MSWPDAAFGDLRLVEDLRHILPPIWRNEFPVFHERVALDCEWDSDGDGGLTMIGVGNLSGVTQFCWRELDETTRAKVGAWIIDLIQRVTVVYWNADVDLRKLRAHSIYIGPQDHKQLEDGMLAHAVLHCEEEHTLEYCQGAMGKLPPYKHLRGVKGAEDVYNASDLVETLYVWADLERQFLLDPAAEAVYRNERLALLPYVINDEERGIRVNQSLVYPLYDKFEERRQQAAKLARAYTGRLDFNLGSPDQLKLAVYDIAGFPVQYARAGGWDQEPKPTLDKDALAALRRMVFTEWDPDDEPTLAQAVENIETGGHPMLESRYLYFGAQQALSHYIEPCFVWEGEEEKAKIVGVRDRIYPECRQHVQVSGRHSYVKPSDPGKSGMAMQQLKGELEHLVHPDPGTRWIGHDWSNIETWLLGALAGDDLILEAKRQGWDTHVLNYCDITGTPYPPILTKALHTAPECEAWRAAIRWQGEDDQRRVFAKRFVYRLHYRGQAESAGDIPGARALKFDVTRLVTASELYLGKHPAIPVYWKMLEKQIDETDVVYAFMGMPRRLTSEYRNARYREGCNHPMQAGVAHIYNTTRLLIHRALPWLEFMFGKHDSHWWQCPAALVELSWPIYKAIVERAFIINGMKISFPASFKERTPAA